MTATNETQHNIKEFLLAGIPGLQAHQNLLFIALLLVYLAVMVGNLLILYLVLLDQRLHTPMYFFLCHLSLLDILITTTILPKMFAVILLEDRIISFSGCFLQMYLVLAIGCTENLILIVMAYDRYIAIMKPLHYHLIINGKLCVLLTVGAWVLGYLTPFVPLINALSLTYCGPNTVAFCYCDYPTVVSLACADVTDIISMAFIIAMCIVNIPLLLILFSYLKIILNIYFMNTEDSKKAFSTCSSHLIVVLTYYFSADLLYITVMIGNISADARVIIGVFIYLLTPLLNPIIYSLRNKQIKQAAEKYLDLPLRPITFFH
ncbi:olfactory receptor 2AT4-like [Erpetoichthys calabaricus]|uniref:olfactory receptor 2AT4-like n=1 Tax=Erpetoichthys calabaricus TaxID=27687 RepID=UPI002233F994|nr:olfactory receptor 2AT4-like [Erpetoichthys calabaricus]